MSLEKLELIAGAAGLLTVLTGVGFRSFNADIRAAQVRVRAGSRSVTTRSGPIEYAQLGRGSPLLVVHGAGGGYDQGLISARPLTAHGFCVTAMSRFGYLGTPLPADASPRAQADAHAHLLDALQIRKTIVIGVSAGAPSALQFAIRHPQRCQALVLLMPLTWKPDDVPDTVPMLSRQARLCLPWLIGSDALFWLALRLARSAVIQGVLGTPPGIIQLSANEQVWLDEVLETILPLSSRAAGLRNDARIASSLARYDLEAIRAPTLVVSARDDLYGTFAAAQYTAQQVRGAQFIGYEHGGHLCAGHHAALLDEIASFAEPLKAESEVAGCSRHMRAPDQGHQAPALQSADQQTPRKSPEIPATHTTRHSP